MGYVNDIDQDNPEIPRCLDVQNRFDTYVLPWCTDDSIVGWRLHMTARIDPCSENGRRRPLPAEGLRKSARQSYPTGHSEENLAYAASQRNSTLQDRKGWAHSHDSPRSQSLCHRKRWLSCLGWDENATRPNPSSARWKQFHSKDQQCHRRLCSARSFVETKGDSFPIAGYTLDAESLQI